MAKKNGRQPEVQPPAQDAPPEALPVPTQVKDTKQGDRKPPAAEFRLGRIRATVWENFSEGHGSWYSVVVTRSYKHNDQWKTAQSFGRDDLLVIAEVVRMTYHWISKQLGGGQRQQNGDAEIPVATVATTVPPGEEPIPF